MKRIILSLLVFIFGFMAVAFPKLTDRDYVRVKDVALDSNKYLHDTDRDNVMLCLDCAIVFYKLWTWRYGTRDIRLVVNRKPNPNYPSYSSTKYILNHIYMEIWSGGYWVKVDSNIVRGFYNHFLYVLDGFKEEYDPAYDIYDEQEYWLNECPY